MANVFRVFVEKKEQLAHSSTALCEDIVKNLRIPALTKVRIINRYDIQGLSLDEFNDCLHTILSEPPVDNTYNELDTTGYTVIATEFLPGQFDQRADSCAQCISLLTGKKRPIVRTATIYLLEGNLTDSDIAKIESYLINPVEARKASLSTFDTLDMEYEIPSAVVNIYGFISFDEAALNTFLNDFGLAMDLDDVKFCQAYFRDTEKRDPTVTEIRMIDTYWSDHCRHTTFSTNIENVDIAEPYIKDAFDLYISMRDDVYSGRSKKDICLMDIATIGMKYLKKNNLLPDLDLSEEINACSVKIRVDIDGVTEDYLLMFKNETHNHPTEIEPFGGAATCLGGAIRDPLSGRVYVYQAMRVTGSSDPTVGTDATIKGKLPTRKIVTGAASGYSSYGNQIGLATGIVNEFYHSGYVAKRLEIGAVIGAAPAKSVVREVPQDGDIVVLIGGRTGRDGCGGATGSSKSHTLSSIQSCSAEVQKGNPPEERKIQRLFRNEAVTKLIKRCNDFGAGGISVAVGELSDGLIINLDAVPKKYDGLDGTELAISESQERMAVVVSPSDVDKIIKLSNDENLEATVIATVTDKNRLEMIWTGQKIVDISRDFLNSNGAKKQTDVRVNKRDIKNLFTKKSNDLKADFVSTIASLNVCSQKGLVERFDSTIGAGTVLMPFGGKYQLSPAIAMAALIPTFGKTQDCSIMSYGFNPYLSQKSPFHGAVFAVVEAVSKVVATGGDISKIWLTLQEYFPRTKNDPSRFGLPFEALLGAMYAQKELGYGAIGGKDSMSGSFEDIDVPPTLVAFAVSVSKTFKVVSSEFKKANSSVFYVKVPLDDNNLPDFKRLLKIYSEVSKNIDNGNIISSFVVTEGGICEAVSKMCFGNKLGFEFSDTFDSSTVFDQSFGSFVFEANENLEFASLLGTVTDSGNICIDGNVFSVDELVSVWKSPLESVFPLNANSNKESVAPVSYPYKNEKSPAIKVARPRVVIPVFPGTNCEYDTAKVFEQNGAQAEIIVIKNYNEAVIKEAVDKICSAINQSQIIMLPGGFSGGDEPDGSGKFIATFFRNSAVMEATHNLLNNRDGLMLGICNGFQALIKLGLVPDGKITNVSANNPTLTFNTIGRHQSSIVRTKICSTLSPWLSSVAVGDIHTVAISHGEGRFIADDETLSRLIKNGQVATQYVDLNGQPTMDIAYNPNQSYLAIEGITSADGRVFGKMAHSERTADGLYKNVVGNYDQKIFKSGVLYFK